LALVAAWSTAALSAPWTRQCEGAAGSDAERCFIQQNVAVGRQVVMVGSIGIPGPNLKPRATITVPLNTLLNSGLTMRVDGEPETLLRFDYCTQQGCRASVEISDLLRKNLLSGKVLHVVWRGIDGKPAQLQFDLAGFSAAWSSVVTAK
jgi:invasion protein IalB